MGVQWFHERDPAGNRIFDSWWEAEEWADSILGNFYPFDAIGYVTPDEKVLATLSRVLPKYICQCEIEATVCIGLEVTNGETLFKIWTIRGATPLLPNGNL